MSNTFKLRPTHFSRGDENFSREGFAPLVTELVVLCLFSTIQGINLEVKTPATTPTKIAFPQINCNVKEMRDACKKKNL